MDIHAFRNKVVAGLQNYLKKTGDIHSLFMLVTPLGDFQVKNLAPLAHYSKPNLALFLKQACREVNPLFTAFVSSGTALKIKEEDIPKYFKNDKLKYEFFSPQYHPDAMPYVIVNINSQAGEKIFMYFKIQQVETIKQLELVKEIETTEMKGVFSDLI